MSLDPQIKEVLKVISSFQIDLNKITPQEYRNLFRQAALSMIEKKIEVKNTQDLFIDSDGEKIRLRIYEPLNCKEPYPITIYYHGGGFVLGDVDVYDNVCRMLANLSNSLVVSVDYRLAPEYKFPTQVKDCYNALKWVHENAWKIKGDSSKIIVAGDSAGGNLASVVSIVARDRNEKLIRAQVLIYPVVNMLDLSPSVIEFSEGYFLTLEQMLWFNKHYFSDLKDAMNPYASPIFAELKDLPPALIITAEYDPLRDQAETFAKILRSKGNNVTCIRANGLIHGFINFFEFVESAKTMLAIIAGFIRFISS
mgnify:CR=1 FL=1